MDLVAVGEVMLELISEEPLRNLPQLGVRVAGDTFNVAATARRLGSRTGYVGLVGDDPSGEAVVEGARALGVDTSGLRRVPGRTGMYLVSTDPKGERSFTYYRNDSVAKRLDSKAVADSPATSARAVHVSGISMALSPSCRRAALAALRSAAVRGALTSYDVNFRPALVDRAAAVRDASVAAGLGGLLAVGCEEAAALAGVSSADGAVEWGWSLGAEDVLVSEGREGVTLGVGGPGRERRVLSVRAPEVQVVDTTGAGDVLVGAFLHGRLQGWDALHCLRFACAAASLSVKGRGALGALPSSEEVERILPKVRER